MKKIFLSLAVLAMTALTANAQLLVGGSLGMNIGSNNGATEFDMYGIPVVGYSINDNWEAGVSVLLGGDVSKQFNTFQWSVIPYAHYYFFNRSNWQIGIKGKANIGGDVHIGAGSSTMAVTWGLNFLPIVTYSPKEHWVLIATFEFLGVGLNGVGKNCNFGLNVMNGGASQIGLGFAYMF